MSALFARSAVRGRWRSLVLLALLAALAVTVVVATLQAAGRSERAFDRLRRATNASDIRVFVEEPATPAEATERVRRTDGVSGAGAEAELFVRPVGTDLFPTYDLLARAPLGEGGHVNIPVVVSGRLPEPSRVNELAVSERLASDLRVGVGDDLPLESVTDAWVDTAFAGGDPGPPDGPRVPMRVVGIVRSPADFGRVLGVLHLTPAFVARYGAEIRTYSWVEAALEPGAGGPVREALGGAAERSFFGDGGATDDGLATIATALRLVAVAAAAAGAATVVLAIARTTRAVLRDRDALVALGSTRSQLIGAVLTVVLPLVAVGALLGGLVGVWLTPNAMVGLAARIEPDAARTVVEWPIALAGVGGTVVLAAGTVLFVASRRARTAAARATSAARLVRLDRPLPVILGLRQAVAGGSELGGRTSRAALVVGVVGLAGVVGALTVSGSIERVRSDSSLFGGWGAARSVDSGESVEVFDALMPELTADRRVASLTGLHISFDARVEGREVTLLALDQRRGPLDASIVDGRAPRTHDEVALGPATLERVGAEVGEQVVMDGPEGEGTYRVVGAMLFPEGDFSFDDGAATTVAGAEAIVGDPHDTGAIHGVRFAWAEGVDAVRADREVAAAGFRVTSDVGGVKPARVTNLGQVAELPRYLAAFLGVLVLALLGHALAVGSRRRVREQATLRALGLTSRAGASVIVVQAAVLAGVAVVVGIPLGVLVGTRIWSEIATSAHVVVRTVIPGGWVAIVVAGVVVGVTLVAAVPVARTRRIRPAQALRAE